MPNFDVELSILTGIILGLILAFLKIGGIFALVFVGFVAVFLTNDDEASYKIGAMAGGALYFIYFVVGFFISPDIPYQLPNPLGIGVGYAFEGLFTLILSLVVGVLLYGLLGAIGGYFADKLFKPQDKPKRPKQSRVKRKVVKRSSKPPRRTLQRRVG